GAVDPEGTHAADLEVAHRVPLELADQRPPEGVPPVAPMMPHPVMPARVVAAPMAAARVAEEILCDERVTSPARSRAPPTPPPSAVVTLFHRPVPPESGRHAPAPRVRRLRAVPTSPPARRRALARIRQPRERQGHTLTLAGGGDYVAPPVNPRGPHRPQARRRR